jgi:LCP family protein required for cell wall assembly
MHCHFPFTSFKMLKKTLWVLIIGCLLVTGCGGNVPAVQTDATAWYLVTADPNATSTPTPFLPLATSVLSPENSPTPTELATLAFVEETITPTVDPTLLPPTETQIPPIDLSLVPTAMSVSPDRDTINFLLLGSDTRGGTSFRTDTIVIAILHTKTGAVSLLSIPRDTWVYIPTYDYQRINTAYLYGEMNGYPGGGPGLLKDTISYNFGLPIDHTAMVDFDGFRRIVDAMGGVEVPVVCPYTDWRLLDPSYDPENENNWALYTVGPGVVQMDGDLTLWYARSRKRSNDFDRGRRQQEVLRAIYDRALRANILTRLPQLYSEVGSVVSTDMSFTDILSLAPLSLKLTNADIRSYYFNVKNGALNDWITPEGAYVLLPNNTVIQSIVAEAMSPGPRAAEETGPLVEVQNGAAFDGWDALAAQRLNYSGFETSLKPADNRDQAVTYLYDFTTTQDRTVTSKILAVLGLPESTLISVPTENSPLQYVLLIGSDYQPCFDPNQVTP